MNLVFVIHNKNFWPPFLNLIYIKKQSFCSLDITWPVGPVGPDHPMSEESSLDKLPAATLAVSICPCDNFLPLLRQTVKWCEMTRPGPVEPNDGAHGAWGWLVRGVTVQLKGDEIWCVRGWRLILSSSDINTHGSLLCFFTSRLYLSHLHQQYKTPAAITNLQTTVF